MMRLPMITALVAVIALATMVCDAEAGARRSRPLKSGQTTCWGVTGTVISCAGTGQDGELQRGEPRAYQDFGNGTVRDKRAALTWEKLADDGSIHDKDNQYSWAQAFDKIDALNTPPCFAGSCDWRLPSPFELYSIVNAGTPFPAVSPVFNTSCVPACTVLTCSCTKATSYWTSATIPDSPASALLVAFFGAGSVGGSLKTNALFGVRAVRGGS